MASTVALEQRIIETSVGKLSVYIRPGERALVFWPSLFADHRSYDRVLPLLNPADALILIDGPGFGASDPPRGHVPPERYAQAVVEVMRKLSIERATFIGTSWGGQVGAHLAVQAPQLLEGLIMANTPVEANLGLSGLPNQFIVLGTRLAGRSRFWANGVTKTMLSETTRSRDPSVAADIGAAFANFDPRSAAHTARSVLTRSNGLRDVLPRIGVPTVVIAGDEDKLYPPAGLEALARLIPDARFVLAVGSGHLTALEAPEYIVDAINLLGARPEVLAQ